MTGQAEWERRQALSKALLALWREDPWRGARWFAGLDALEAEYGKEMVEVEWAGVREYIREMRS